ncbi:unnamed protein product [Musa acuminata subsp. burmannicoides]
MAAKNGASSIEKEQQIFGMAEKEMEYRVDLFNRLFKLISLLSQRSASQLPRALSGLYGFPQELAQTLHYCGSLAKCWLTQTCFDKCIEKRYKESELNMGENSCIDRCVSKYWQVTNIVGQLLGSNRPPM